MKAGYYPWPMRSRDAIVSYVMKKNEDRSWLLSWKGDARAGDPKDTSVTP